MCLYRPTWEVEPDSDSSPCPTKTRHLFSYMCKRKDVMSHDSEALSCCCQQTRMVTGCVMGNSCRLLQVNNSKNKLYLVKMFILVDVYNYHDKCHIRVFLSVKMLSEGCVPDSKTLNKSEEDQMCYTCSLFAQCISIIVIYIYIYIQSLLYCNW